MFIVALRFSLVLFQVYAVIDIAGTVGALHFQKVRVLGGPPEGRFALAKLHDAPALQTLGFVRVFHERLTPLDDSHGSAIPLLRANTLSAATL